MRVARLLLPSHSCFDLKCFVLDREAAPEVDEAAWSLASATIAGCPPLTRSAVADALRGFRADVLHVYGSGSVPHGVLSAAAAPWVADRPLNATRPLFGRSPRAQAKVLADEVAEPVADAWFTLRNPVLGAARRRIGSLRQGKRTGTIRDLVAARIHRFRDDIDWVLFEAPPDPAAMVPFDLWVDLADDETELDGLTAEALALGVPLVATRTAANRRRSGDGRAAALCPKGDPNEIAHAIVTMLFKPERAEPLIAAAAGLREQFRPARRREALVSAYAGVLA